MTVRQIAMVRREKEKKEQKFGEKSSDYIVGRLLAQSPKWQDNQQRIHSITFN